MYYFEKILDKKILREPWTYSSIRARQSLILGKPSDQKNTIYSDVLHRGYLQSYLAITRLVITRTSL